MSAMLLIKSKTSQTIVSVGSLGIENFEQNHYSLEWKLKLLTDRNSKAKYNSFNLHVSFIFQNQWKFSSVTETELYQTEQNLSLYINKVWTCFSMFISPFQKLYLEMTNWLAIV